MGVLTPNLPDGGGGREMKEPGNEVAGAHALATGFFL